MGVGTLKMAGQRAVFLDRDGVLNRAIVRQGKPYPPDTLAQVEIVPGAADMLAGLKNLGLRLLVVTNQPDVARGKQDRAVVEAINAHLSAALPLDKIYTCYHDDSDACECRKPLPGLLEQGATEWQVDLSRSFLIGDRWKDVAAGQAAGCTTFLIDLDYAEQIMVEPDYHVSSLEEAASLITNLVAN